MYKNVSPVEKTSGEYSAQKCQEQEEAHVGTITHPGPNSIGKIFSPATKKQKVEENIIDCEIISPPPRQYPETMKLSSVRTPDEVEIVNSTVTNPTIAYVHMRFQCGVHPFITVDSSKIQSPSEQARRQAANRLFCNKCYCYICDIPASQCKNWLEHCLAHDKDVRSASARLANRMPTSIPKTSVEVIDIEALPSNPNPNGARQSSVPAIGSFSKASTPDPRWFYSDRCDGDKNAYKNQWGTREMKITEILAANLANIDLENNNPSSSSSPDASAEQEKVVLKMEGDLPQLNLTDDIFIEGIRVGWPYPQIMQPQRLMAIHLIKALKGKRHVILESPTGTGKSAAILCSVLAWQRWYRKFGITQEQPKEKSDDGSANPTSSPKKVPRIVYCSRTHSQVAQMVSSLRKTPYRPRMAILGSRDRLCIHR